METRAAYTTQSSPVQVHTFTPIFDAVVRDVGLVGASVYGRIWRYCQGGRHCCNAALDTIAETLNISRRTVIRWAKDLCDQGYLQDLTPDLRNKPHTYIATNKLRLVFEVRAEVDGVTESPDGVTESHSHSDRKSLEETIEETIEETEEQESADADPPPVLNFEDWLKAGQATSNKNAVLKRMHDTLFPDRESPDYGYIGTVVKRVGGPGRLAQLLWEAAAKRPTGDVLAYIQATVKGKSNGNGRHDRHNGGEPAPVIIQPGEARWLTEEEMAELDRAQDEGRMYEYIASLPGV